MDQPELGSSSSPAVGRPDRPLGRGLADVSDVFLSQEAGGRRIDPSGGRGAGRPLPREESASKTVLLRPTAQVAREQIAAAVREFEGALEEGLRGIDAEIPCPPCGEIDLLAVDRANQLTIIDFDTTSSDELFIRGLGHFDWVVGNVPNLRRMFRGQAINFSLQPRLLLIAPQFSSRVRCAARQIAHLQIDWVRYHFVETPGRAGIFFERLSAE